MGRNGNRLRLQSYAALLLVLLVYIVASPALREGSVRVGWVARILLPVLLLASLSVAMEHRRQLVGLAALTVVLLLLDWTLPKDHPAALDVARHAIRALFELWIVLIVLRHLFRADEVTADIILGAACAFLLLGLAFAEGYALMEIAAPGSFKSAQGGEAIEEYFSLVTMTTLGYGDIVPVRPVARSLAALHAFVGQFYIAVIVARIVAMHVTSRKPEA